MANFTRSFSIDEALFMTKYRISKGTGILILLLTVLVTPSVAQTNKATITGTVTDPNGAVIAGATVKIVNVNTRAERTVTTNEDGTYNAPLLDIGTYNVTASATGFQSVTLEFVTLQIGDRLPIDVQLRPTGTTESVTITAEPPIVQSESSDRGSVITGREVTELPLNGRNFTQLATLTPGVSRVTIGTLSDARANNNGDPNAGGQGPGGGDSRGSTESARFARSGGAVISANGQRPTNNNFSVDGVDNNEPQFGTLGVFVNPDAIAEFKVTTSVPQAEVGRAAGAVVNTSFKSGSNDFHGSLYYYGQNSSLNAVHPILKRRIGEAQARGDAVLPKKAVQQVHEFGGTIGGPIFENRTFFFFDYLGGRNNFPTPLASTVPSQLVRNGDFSEYTNFQVRDPRTGQPFPGNRIPANRLSPNAVAFFNLFPLPTANVLNPDQFNNNFFSEREVREEIDNFDIKVDHRLGANDQLSGRYSYQDNKNVRSSFFPAVPAGFGAGDEVNNTRQVVVSETHTFSPSILNDFRFGFTKIEIGILNCGVGGACGISETFTSDVGVPNVNDGSFEQSGSILTGGFGNGFVEFAGDGGPFIVNSKNPYFADTLTIIKGNHSVKFGGELRLRYLETIDGGRTGGLKGNLAYGDGGPATGVNPNCPPGSGTPNACFVDTNGLAFGGTGLAIANILLKDVAATQTFRGSVPGGAFNLRSQEIGLFVQDDWKVNDQLTLNLGLRYDLFPSATEKEGRLGNFDVVTGRVVMADGSGDRLVDTDKNNFGPRIGIAYAIGPEKNMVIRGGYGLLYTLDATDRPPLVQNPPFTNSVAFDPFAAGTGRSVFNLESGPPNVPTVDPANIPTSVRVFFVDPNQTTAYVHQFNVSVQYQFRRDWAVDIGYVGSRARSLLATRDIGAGGTASARNAAGQFLQATAYENRAEAKYDALQVQLNKRFSHSIQGQVSYTYSHNIDDSTGVFQGIGEGRGSVGGPQNPFCLECERGNSSLDVRHLLVANAIVDLPFGKGQPFLDSGGISDKIFGGYQLNFIVMGRTGYPFTVVDGDNQSRRATLIGDPFAGTTEGRFLNAAAFIGGDNVSTNAAGAQIFFGSLARNTFTSPDFIRTDFSVFKTTTVTETIRFQLGFEFFNVFNQATFTVPNNNFRDAGSFGRFDAALPARVIQYRLKVLF